MAESVEIQIAQMFAEIWDEQNTRISAALGRVAPKMADRIRMNFDAKGARGGRSEWLITSNPTPLIKTRRLYNSIETRVTRERDGFSLETGTEVSYAAKHNQGLEGMPRREFLFFTDDDIKMLMDELETS